MPSSVILAVLILLSLAVGVYAILQLRSSLAHRSDRDVSLRSVTQRAPLSLQKLSFRSLDP